MNKRIIAAFGTVILGASVIAGIGTYVASAKNDSRIMQATAAGTMQTPVGTLPHYTLSLSTYPDSMAGTHGRDGGAHPDYVTYGPITNFEVPAHSAITITVTNYDSGASLNNDYFRVVRGTIDGTATLNGQTIHSISTDEVGHTFTVHGMSNENSEFFFSVPMKAVADSDVPDTGYTSKPNVTTFTVVTGNAGEYIWNCEYPCGDGSIARFGKAMSTMGYMSGHFNVVDK
jgi:hypothetical protein